MIIRYKVILQGVNLLESYVYMGANFDSIRYAFMEKEVADYDKTKEKSI